VTCFERCLFGIKLTKLKGGVMFKNFITVVVVVLLIFSISFAGNINDQRAQRVTPADDEVFMQRIKGMTSTVNPPAIEARSLLGGTWYDYETNNVTARHSAYALDTQDGQDGMHFVFAKIATNGAQRYVTYDYYDFGLGIFYGNQSVDETLGRTGWIRVVNGHDDVPLMCFHSPIFLYQDATEAAYTFSQIVSVPGPTNAAVFPGLALDGDNVVLMGQLANANYVGGDTVLVSTDYMASWTGRNIWPLEDPLTTDLGVGEMWPSINPQDPNEFSVLYGPDVTASAPNGSIRMATTTDLAATWSTMEIWNDDNIVLPDSEQYVIENFCQMNGMYSADGVYHVVFGAVQGSYPSSTQTELFPILYWNTRDQQMVELTDPFYGRPTDPTVQAALANNRPGNGLGNAYPSIATGNSADELLVVWQQWEDDGAGGIVLLDAAFGGGTVQIFATDIWGSYSNDGGVTWSDPFFVAGNPAESDIYPILPEHFLWNTTMDSIYIDLNYMYDTNPGTSVFATPNSDPSEALWYYERAVVPAVPAGAIAGNVSVVDGFQLAQNYPNPFNPSTNIKFELKKTANVTLEVFNTLGQKVSTLVNSKLAAGPHEVAFNGKDLASGLYLYRLTADNVTLTKKMMLMK
jgi:hypothetical protein